MQGISLSGYVFDGLSVPSAFVRISSVSIMPNVPEASIIFDIFINPLVIGSNAPLTQNTAAFQDGMPTGTTLYTSTFGSIPPAPTDTTITSSTYTQTLLTLAYSALLVHPSFSSLFVGSTYSAS